jgi:predicted enzyme related to lactoylglutathione lyase
MLISIVLLPQVPRTLLVMNGNSHLRFHQEHNLVAWLMKSRGNSTCFVIFLGSQIRIRARVAPHCFATRLLPRPQPLHDLFLTIKFKFKLIQQVWGSIMAEATPKPSNSSTSPPFKYQKPSAGSFCFATIPVSNTSRAQAFYSAVFEWTFWSPDGSSPVIFHTGGEVMGRLSLHSATESQPASSAGVTLYTLVDDVDATVKKVIEAGGSIEQDKFVEGGHTEMALFRDTEGNLGGILHWLF